MRRFYRSPEHKIIAGVCRGLAEHFDVNPIIVRLVFIALSGFAVLPGIATYIILWLILPVRQE